MLKEIGDLERILTRVGAALGAAARSRAAARQPRAPAGRCAAWPRRSRAERLQTLAAQCGAHAAERALLAARARRDAARAAARRRRHRAGLRRRSRRAARASARNADQYLEDLEARERARTGIANLKVGYNRVHGFYIEMTRAQAASAPADYIRRQTLEGRGALHHARAQGVRGQGAVRARARARRARSSSTTAARAARARARRVAAHGRSCVAELDALSESRRARRRAGARASRASSTSARLEYRGGRHSGVEQSSAAPFVPNDLALDDGHDGC